LENVSNGGFTMAANSLMSLLQPSNDPDKFFANIQRSPEKAALLHCLKFDQCKDHGNEWDHKPIGLGRTEQETKDEQLSPEESAEEELDSGKGKKVNLEEDTGCLWAEKIVCSFNRHGQSPKFGCMNSHIAAGDMAPNAGEELALVQISSPLVTPPKRLSGPLRTCQRRRL
jgi:hypothetical protein